MVKRSQGLNVYKRLAQEARRRGKGTGPTYMDGEAYRVGDEVLEGHVVYARPVKADEDGSVDRWRLVVAVRDGGISRIVEPSKTRAIKRETP